MRNSVWSASLVLLTACVFPSSEIPCNFEFGINIDNGEVLPSGAIVKDNITYTPDNYKEINGVKIGCICNIKTCIRKCCPLGEYMTNRTCVPTETPFILPENKTFSVNSYQFVYGNDCKRKKTRTLLDPASISEQEFVFEKDGRLKIIYSKDEFKQRDYCVDYIEDENVTKALVCAYASDITATNQIGMVISMPFLLATFIVYAILPDKKLHGKSIMCYVISLFGGYLLLAIIQFNPDYFETLPCTILGITCLFFFMGSFFWMNVISIDIWWTFSGLRGFSGSRKETEHKRFLLYSTYAWGVPLLFVIVVTCLTLSSIPLDTWYNPGIADGRCWFREETPAGVYFFGPVALLIVINITLFCITAWNIKQVQKDTAVFKKSNSKKHTYEKDKQKFNLFLKLMLAMGINWSMEIISWLVNWQVTQVPHGIWYLTDFCNAVYGIFIFFMFAFKKSIWKSLKKRYYMLIGQPHLARSTMEPQRSQSSRTNLATQKIPVVHFINQKLTSEGA